MELRDNTKNTRAVTGVFAIIEDAENAYNTLIELGYSPEEITLIMSDEICNESYDVNIGSNAEKGQRNTGTTISDALDNFGKYISVPGMSFVVAGTLDAGGQNVLADSVMSDRYAEYFKTRIKDGEILIDVVPHNMRERNFITSLWENYGGDPIIFRPNRAA